MNVFEVPENLRELGKDDWDCKDFTPSCKQVKAFKEKMKKYLLEQQNNKCGYCGIELGIFNYAFNKPHLEHFLDKAKFGEDTFRPINLVYACPTCNYKKNNNIKKKKGTFKFFRKNKKTKYISKDFTLFHPHLHKFSEYFITNMQDCEFIYIAREGKNKVAAKLTIEIFDVNDEARLTQRAKDYIRKKLCTNNEDEKLIQEILQKTRTKKS